MPLWVLACLLSGCGRAPQPASDANTAPVKSAKPIVFPRDDLDREVPLKSPAQRVVVIGPGAVETVFALGKGGVLVGRDSGSDYPPQDVKRVPVVADFNGPSFEAVVAQRPDFIIVQGETYDRARVESWQSKCGAPVAQLSATKVFEVADDIRKIGAWLGAKEQAKPVAADVEVQVGSSVVTSSAPRAFFEISRAPLWTAGSETLISDALTGAGLQNFAQSVSGYKPYSLETLTAKQPDYYVVTAKPNERAKALQELKRHPILGRLKCVWQGRVIVVDGDLILRPGPRLAQGIELLERAVRSAPLPIRK